MSRRTGLTDAVKGFLSPRGSFPRLPGDVKPARDDRGTGVSSCNEMHVDAHWGGVATTWTTPVSSWTISESGVTRRPCPWSQNSILSSSFRRRPSTLLKRSSRRARKKSPRPGNIVRSQAMGGHWLCSPRHSHTTFSCSHGQRPGRGDSLDMHSVGGAFRCRDRERSGSAWQERQCECISRCLGTGSSTTASRWRSPRCSFTRSHELEPIAGPSDGPVETTQGWHVRFCKRDRPGNGIGPKPLRNVWKRTLNCWLSQTNGQAQMRHMKRLCKAGAPTRHAE